jgi:hypothetical protein
MNFSIKVLPVSTPLIKINIPVYQGTQPIFNIFIFIIIHEPNNFGFVMF